MARLLGLARRNRNDPEAFSGLVHACRYSGLLEASEAAHREVRRLDPHMPTSVRFTLWAKGDIESLLAETADGTDFELRVMALLMRNRTDEAREILRKVGARRLSPILDTMLRGLGALLDNRGGAMGILNEALVSHKDPEALFMLAACQAYTGDDRALSSLTQAVESGYRVPAALKTNPWLSDLRRAGRLDALIEQAEAGRREAMRVLEENRGQELLGPI
jgi:hypothetical protein